MIALCHTVADEPNYNLLKSLTKECNLVSDGIRNVSLSFLNTNPAQIDEISVIVAYLGNSLR